MLLVLVMLTRGLGQSALSVASLNLVGQWFQRRLTKAMGLYSVLASALGPLLLAGCMELTGSYAPVFRIMAAVVALLAVAAWLVKVPEKASGKMTRIRIFIRIREKVEGGDQALGAASFTNKRHFPKHLPLLAKRGW